MACCAPMTSSVCPLPLSRMRHTEEFECSPSLRPLLGLANLVLEDTVERIYTGNTFAEKWCGLFLIRGENVVLLGEIVPSHLSPTCCDDSWLFNRIWIKKTTSHCIKSITSSSTVTINKTSQQRSRGKKRRQRSYTSRKGSVRKEGRAMVIEICSPRFPADSLKPRGKWGQSLVVDSFHFVGHYSNHTTVPMGDTTPSSFCPSLSGLHWACAWAGH